MKKETYSYSLTRADLSELTPQQQLLVESAKKASENAYAPYSNFLVGAAVELESGEILVGNNQENSAYPSGICAERNALFHVGAVHPNKTITRIAIYTPNSISNALEVITPCGACRQVMLEYEAKQHNAIEVILVGPKNNIVLLSSCTDLMPLSFVEFGLQKKNL